MLSTLQQYDHAPESAEIILARFAKRVTRRALMLHPVISLRRKYVYFPIAKAGNSSIKYELRAKEAADCYYTIKATHETFHPPLVAPAQLDPNFYVDEVLRGDFFRFTFVRNPFSRVLSCYLDRILGIPGQPVPPARKQLCRQMKVPLDYEVSFAEFVEFICSQNSYDMNEHWRDQYSTLQCGEISLDFIGKLESLAGDLEFVSRRVCRPNETPLSHEFNKSPQKTSATARLGEFYDARLTELVRKRYERDFVTYGYAMEIGIAG